MTTKYFSVAGTLVFLLSCNSFKREIPSSFLKPENVITGVIYRDSLAKPYQVEAPHLPAVPAGSPRMAVSKNNVSVVGRPERITSFKHDRVVPGVNGCPLPSKAIAIDKKNTALMPEVVMAEHPATRDKYPQNFTFFNKLQGLSSNDIYTVYEDSRGNLWIGTIGRGVNRYDGRTFSQFTEIEGLGENYIRFILEDVNDNMWFGTLSNGISRYDGFSFTNYTVSEGLSSNSVLGMAIDKNNILWIATPVGLNAFHGKHFTTYGKDILGSDTILALMADKNGNIWLSIPQGIIKYDGEVFNRFFFTESSVMDRVGTFSNDANGNIWCATSNGILKFDGVDFFRYTMSHGLLCNAVFCIEGDKDGNLWLACPGGITKFDGKTMMHFRYDDELSDYKVWDLFEDRRGNLWMGTTGGGLCRYGGKNFNHFTISEGLNSNKISGILEYSGNIWLSTLNGVSKFDQKSFAHFSTAQGLINNIVWGMMKDSKNNLWFGTWQGVSKYDGKSFTNYTDKDGLGDNDVKCIIEDRKGNIWFGTKGGVTSYDGKTFTRYAGKNGPGDDAAFCFSMLEDRSGNLWLGSSEGIAKYDGRNFTNFIVDHKCGKNAIYSIIEDGRGHIWFGTGACGLLRYDGTNFRRFSRTDGLGSNAILSIMEDKRGNIWCATDNGLSKLDSQRIAGLDVAIERDNHRNDYASLFKSYTYDDGFLGQGGNPGKTIFEAKDGTIWIGARDRLTAHYPGEKQKDSIAPNIQLAGISLFNENVPWHLFFADSKRGRRDTAIVLTNGNRIHDIQFDSLSRWYGTPNRLSLAYDNNFISFHFVGITIQSPKRVRYRYKLEGFDHNWSAPSYRNDVTYGNLSYGTYTFKVKAINSDGYASDELSYAFTIREPWWHTWWAYMIFAVLFLSGIYIAWRIWIKKISIQHERVLQKHRIAELEMQALRAQMNPHFIFNSLNSIQLFILENNKQQASEYLVKFSRLIRLILDNSEETFIPLKNELEALRLYLELESLRFEEKFTFNIDVAEDVDTASVKVPPLIIQPYAENAIWHGLMHKAEPGRLKIQIYERQRLLYCKIADDGIGRKRAGDFRTDSERTSKSMGMRITADRIATLPNALTGKYNVVVNDIILSNGEPGGTEVLLTIPVII